MSFSESIWSYYLKHQALQEGGVPCRVLGNFSKPLTSLTQQILRQDHKQKKEKASGFTDSFRLHESKLNTHRLYCGESFHTVETFLNTVCTIYGFSVVTVNYGGGGTGQNNVRILIQG